MSTLVVDLSRIWKKLNIEPVVRSDFQIGTIFMDSKDFTLDDVWRRIRGENVSISDTGYQLIALTHEEAIQAKSSGALDGITSWMTPVLNDEGKFLRYHTSITRRMSATMRSDLVIRQDTHVLLKLVRS